ncbi:MAG: MopE-related protein [Candidatus Woesearchaeota archaeon]
MNVLKGIYVAIFSLFLINIFIVNAIPPPPPAFNVTLPVFCTITNNGIEICDNLDNDCDGFIDEGLTNLSGCSQFGLCSGSFKTCSSGLWSSCSIVPVTEICNSIDDDCDGIIDDGLTRVTTCGLGVCSNNTGFETCTSGVWNSNTCNPYSGATNEICDGAIDQDCDGLVDENCTCVSGAVRSCGYTNVGECMLGNQTCISGVWGSTCVGVINSQTEVCDNLDNDCDNIIDDNLNDSSSCSQFGLCSGSFKTCSSGIWSSCSIVPVNESCNNIDDNCDGIIDNNLIESFDCNQTGNCFGSVKTCILGNWSSCSIVPVNESCNDIDDDCDGSTDEDVCTPTPRPRRGGSSRTPSWTPSVNLSVNSTTNSTNNSNLTNISPNYLNPNLIGNVNNSLDLELHENSVINNSLEEPLRLSNDTSSNVIENETFFIPKILLPKIFFILLLLTIIFVAFILHYFKNKQTANNESKTNLVSLNNSEMQVLNYINAMREKKFNDEEILSELRLKGWDEKTLSKLFKK